MLTLWENLQLWPWPVPLWQRVWRASTWFSLNHLPAGNHALTKACYGCYKLTLYRTPAITARQLHPSGVASPCRWLGRNWIKNIVAGGKSVILDGYCCLLCLLMCMWSSLSPVSVSAWDSVRKPCIACVSWWFDLHSTCHALCYVWFRSQVEAANHCAKIMWLNVSGLAAYLKGNKWTPNDKVQGPRINICYSQNECGKEKWSWR